MRGNMNVPPCMPAGGGAPASTAPRRATSSGIAVEVRRTAQVPPVYRGQRGRRDERRWKDQQPTRQEWGKGRHKEEWGPPPPPPKGNRREPWRDKSGREGGPRRDQRGGATQALEEEDGGNTVPEMNVLCEVDSNGEKGLF